MRVNSEVLDNRYRRFAELKPGYDKCIKIIRDMLDKAIAKGDISAFSDYQKYYENIDCLRTAETYRIDTIVEIISLENEYEGNIYFFQKCCDYQSLMDHYIRCILFLRRLEMPFDDAKKSEALQYFAQNRFTQYAALMILNNEAFENKSLIASVLFENLHKEETYEKKNIILNQYSILMEPDTFLLEYALLLISENYFIDALRELKKISKPSPLVKELIIDLEKYDG